MHKIKILLQCGVHGQASVAPPTFLAIAPLNFLTFPVYSSPFQVFFVFFFFFFMEPACLLAGTSFESYAHKQDEK